MFSPSLEGGPESKTQLDGTMAGLAPLGSALVHYINCIVLCHVIKSSIVLRSRSE